MKELQIIEGNKLIALFSEQYKYYKFNSLSGNKYFVFEGKQGIIRESDIDFKMNYHNSWDWIMPILHKIDEQERFSYVHNSEIKKIIDNRITIDIETLWLLIVEFIKWYNRQPKYNQ